MKALIKNIWILSLWPWSINVRPVSNISNEFVRPRGSIGIAFLKTSIDRIWFLCLWPWPQDHCYRLAKKQWKCTRQNLSLTMTFKFWSGSPDCTQLSITVQCCMHANLVENQFFSPKETVHTRFGLNLTETMKIGQGHKNLINTSLLMFNCYIQANLTSTVRSMSMGLAPKHHVHSIMSSPNDWGT